MADKKPLVLYAGSKKEIQSGDKIPVENLATGTPDGTKFIRDDGALVVPPAPVFNGGFTGAINDINDTYTISEAIKAGSLCVYYNGMRLRNGTDFTENSSTVFQLSFIPATGESLIIDYIKP